MKVRPVCAALASIVTSLLLLAGIHCTEAGEIKIVSPGAYEDVVRLVVPELQRRGVFRDRYTGSTLRDHLGLPRPEVGASVHA